MDQGKTSRSEERDVSGDLTAGDDAKENDTESMERAERIVSVRGFSGEVHGLDDLAETVTARAQPTATSSIPTLPRNVLELARLYNDLGLRPFPLPRGSKVPIAPWKQYQDRRPTDGELVAAFSGSLVNLAGATSEYVVVDADNPEAVEWVERALPCTPLRTRTKNGVHFFYRAPATSKIGNRAGVSTTGGKKLKLDVRGYGGYVLLPGSQHPDGGMYLPLGDWSVEALDRVPVFDTKWLPTKTPPKPKRTSSKALACTESLPILSGMVGTTNSLIARETATLLATPEGSRNDQLNVAAFKLGKRIAQGQLNRAEVEDALKAAALQVGLNADEIAATIQSGVGDGVDKAHDEAEDASGFVRKICNTELKISDAGLFERKWKEEKDDEGGRRLVFEDKQLANFYLTIGKVKHVVDGDEPGRHLEVEVIRNGVLVDSFNISGPDFNDTSALKAKLQATRLHWWGNRTIEALRNAAQAFFDAEEVTVLRSFGPSRDHGFVSPSVRVQGGALVDDSHVICEMAPPGGSKLPPLDLQVLNDDDFKAVCRHIVEDLLEHVPGEVSATLAAHVVLAAFRDRWESWGYRPYVLALIGSSGTGKSTVAYFYQCFFGTFHSLADLTSWTSTANTVEKKGQLFNGALYVVDDLKKKNMAGQWELAIRVMQNYADCQGRGRLNRNAQLQDTASIRGMLLVTGEDRPDGESSLAARTVDFQAEWQKLKNRDREQRCLDSCNKYSGVTTRLIQWLQKKDDEVLRAVLRQARADIESGCQAEGVVLQDNESRILANYGLAVAGFRLFMSFLSDHEIIGRDDSDRRSQQHLTALVTALRRKGGEVSQETPAKILLNDLIELRSAKEVHFAELEPSGSLDAKIPSYQSWGGSHVGKRVGFLDKKANCTYLLTGAALAVVAEYRRKQGSSLSFSARAINQQLLSSGKAEPSIDGPTHLIKVDGISQRVMKLTGVLGEEEEEAP